MSSSTVASAGSTTRVAELRAAGLKIAGAVAVFAVLYALYSHEVKVEGQVTELISGTRNAGGRAGGVRGDLDKDTPAGWLAAEAGVKKALELQPSNPYGIAALADIEAMLASAGFDDRGAVSDDALARADAKDIALPERFEARALRLIDAGRAGEAESMLLALLARYGSVPRLVDALGRAQRASGKLLEARQSFKRAQDSEWRSPRNVADFATSLLEEGNALDAVAAYDRALQANSEHLRSIVGRARAQAALAKAGRAADLKGALFALEALLVRGDAELPSRPRAQVQAARAELLLAQGDTAGAARASQEAIAAQPKLAAALRAQALVLAAQPGPAPREAALAAFRATLAADPYDASAYFDGASALAGAGDGASAEKLLGAYAATLPRSARYYLALAQLLARKDDTKGADASLALAIHLEPANALLYFEQGRVAQKRKDQKAAVAAYERAAQLRDDFPEVYRQMGSLYLENKDVTGALRVFTEALARYKAARAPPAQMEAFYLDVRDQLSRAGKARLAEQWVKEARAAH